MGEFVSLLTDNLQGDQGGHGGLRLDFVPLFFFICFGVTITNQIKVNKTIRQTTNLGHPEKIFHLR